MKRLVINDWGWMNCVCANVVSLDGAIINRAVVTAKNDCVAVYNTIDCDIIKETEKAFNIQFSLLKRNGNSYLWKVWLPKKSIIADDKIIKTFSIKDNPKLDYFLQDKKVIHTLYNDYLYI